MATSPLEHAADTRLALREIVSEHGTGALSNPAIMTNLLRDFLPDAPQVTRLLVAAAEDRIAEVLAQHVAQGLDVATATRLAASSFASTNLFSPEICDWVVGEIAVAAGLGAGVIADPGGKADTLVATNPPPSNPPTDSGAAGTGTPETIAAGTVGVTRPGEPDVDPIPLPVKPRPKWLIPGVTGAVAVVVLLGVVLVWAPWSKVPVLRPTGLTEEGAGLSTVSFQWQGPATGPVPTKYQVLLDGHSIGFVRGTTTSTQVTHLRPGSSYRFQLVAIRGTEHSVRSAVLVLNTDPQPPLSDAVLEGSWTMVPGHATWYGYSQSPLPLRDETWSFSPSCSSGPCSVSVSGKFQDLPFNTTLTRNGGTYSGTAKYSYSNPSGSTCGPVTVGYLTIRITMQQATVRNDTWQATSWTGTMISNIPARACTAAGITASISSSQ